MHVPCPLFLTPGFEPDSRSLPIRDHSVAGVTSSRSDLLLLSRAESMLQSSLIYPAAALHLLRSKLCGQTFLVSSEARKGCQETGGTARSQDPDSQNELALG